MDGPREDLLAKVLDTVQVGLFVLDRDYNFVWVNRWLASKYEPLMPLVGRKCYSVLRGSKERLTARACATCLETRDTCVETLAYPTEENPSQWFSVSLFPLEDAQGSRVGAVGHLEDITERTLAQEHLTDEVAWRRILVDQSRDGIVVLDEDGKVFEANVEFARMLGYSMGEILSLHVWDWESQHSKSEVMRMLESVDTSGDHFETRHRRKDGTYYDVEISTNGAVYRGRKLVFCVCRDITERNRAQKERESLIVELQQALAEIRALRGILPLCSFCKKVRNDRGYWEQVDVHIQEHSEADVTHGVCPECLKLHYPGVVGEQD